MQRREGSSKKVGAKKGRLDGAHSLGMRNEVGSASAEKVGAVHPFSGLRAIELFAGIGGFRMASDSIGLKTVWANDISKWACTVYRDNFGEKELHEGDISQLAETIPAHDILTGGFPCQPFSSAGKKKGIRDARGTLFQHIVDVLDAHHPKYFVLENVKRLLTMEDGYHFATILSSLSDLNYHIEWRLLNAMNFGLPQNRQRVFLVGVRHDESKGNNEVAIRLANKAEFEDLDCARIETICEPESWKPIEAHGKRFPHWGMARDGRFVGVDFEEIGSSVTPVPLRQVLEAEVGEEFDFTESTLKWLPENTPVNRLVQGVEILSNQAGGARMGYTIFGIGGVAPTLTSTTSRHYERYKIGDRYRRLTNVEYARIQGFPDSHCKSASVYEQYALFGNAVPPAMVSWVMDRLSLPGESLETLTDTNGQVDLFSDAYQRRIAEGAPGPAS